ncbi:MAG: hypothetical protein AAFY53_08875 [Pseudomonadota bacterium]
MRTGTSRAKTAFGFSAARPDAQFCRRERRRRDGADNRATIMRHLGPAPTDIDDLIRATGLDAHVVRATLIDLELSRQIQRVDGRAFARKP